MKLIEKEPLLNVFKKKREKRKKESLPRGNDLQSQGKCRYSDFFYPSLFFSIDGVSKREGEGREEEGGGREAREAKVMEPVTM